MMTSRHLLLQLLLWLAGGVAGHRNTRSDLALGPSSLAGRETMVDTTEEDGTPSNDALVAAYLQGVREAEAKSKHKDDEEQKDLQQQASMPSSQSEQEKLDKITQQVAARLARAGLQGRHTQGGKVPADVPADAVTPGYYGDTATWEYQRLPDAPRLSWWEWLLAVGDGTGASVGGTGNNKMDQDLLNRMRYQDKAVMMLLLIAYAASLFFSASIAYRQAANDSPVTYYSDPRYNHLTTDAEDVESFLDAFNQAPKEAQLQVTGLMQLPPLPEYMVDSAVMWMGARYRIAFSFALDLSPWLVHHGNRPDGDDDYHDATTGIEPEEVERLSRYLAEDTNDLSFVEMEKVVEWKDWEELATNIKSRIRQAGFTGLVNVHRNSQDAMAVHKNRPWANFMHSRTTKVLLALSVVGWFLYQPYMWIRHRAIQIKCRYRVDIAIDQYWPLISDKIGPEGFDSGLAGNIMQIPRASRQQQQRVSQQQQLMQQLEQNHW